MKFLVAAVGTARTRQKSEAADRLAADYLDRSARYSQCEQRMFDTEATLLAGLEQGAGRVPAHVILLDSGGQLLTSEQFAAHLGEVRDNGAQRVVLAIGPADGWSPEAKKRASLLFSLGGLRFRTGWRGRCWRSRCTGRSRSCMGIHTIVDISGARTA